MKIKVGNKVYDSCDEPVMVVLSYKDKENILNMLPEAHKYCAYPDEISEKEIRKWMKLDE